MMPPPVTESLPSESQLAEAASIQICDKDGAPRSFSTLYDDTTKSTMIIFIRHFVCGDCQSYIRTLAESTNPVKLSAENKQLFIVGCGDPALISTYAAETGCPFEIYSERTARLYDVLGMGRSMVIGQKPEYITASLVTSCLTSFGQVLRWNAPFRGGDFARVGGEFLWVKGKLEWCHRMKNTRDHMEVPDVMKVLDEIAIDKPAVEPVKSSQSSDQGQPIARD